MLITICDDKNALGEQAAARGGWLIRKAIAERGECNVAFVTGTSQVATLKALALESKIDWTKVNVFLLDEFIGLERGHKASSSTFLYENFLNLISGVNSFHAICPDADKIDETLKNLNDTMKDHPLDVAFICIGENGHLAFNDPPADFDTKDPYILVELEDRSRLYSYLHGSTLADYINDIQMAVTGADVSAASLFNEPTSLGPEVRLADVLKAYPFSNSLVLVEIEARQLKKAMERSASFAEMNQKGLVVESQSFSPMKDERYNFDFYRGLSYSYDLSKEPGSRVVRMRFKDIDLLAEPGYKLRMVLNSYRASGTGGYDIYREVPVLQSFSTDIQDVLIESFEQAVPVKVPSPTDFEVIL